MNHCFGDRDIAVVVHIELDSLAVFQALHIGWFVHWCGIGCTILYHVLHIFFEGIIGIESASHILYSTIRFVVIAIVITAAHALLAHIHTHRLRTARGIYHKGGGGVIGCQLATVYRELHIGSLAHSNRTTGRGNLKPCGINSCDSPIYRTAVSCVLNGQRQLGMRCTKLEVVV